ncbi:MULTISPECIES: GTP pyrophosphokinase [Latilactobacillus]|jgi:putative GTP pyrophosphokinase|uniref:GTP pyrophosphokinase n=2 Tax=Latilactobacillus curvatus TaxID=28038 RepID=A0A1B2A5T3_LATCU|nr:GTP pyrophosphokinase family protein [Latilactobacillus curvatus]MDT3393150.1 GTP pyrophosphokinase family protein [Bacillota bacterium]ANJ69781.1 GTP pyrophosphokinase [Latilactobacillus curvatus]ANY13377.1 GTP pyrophosphokinase [Latilactobacillus curvatus]AOO75046.1 GTP pyrophosphokinase [Latilactobacillus curvatus]ASN59648.1 GTP pyrophosphokinase [Latilactobacillus curvatus]
MVENWKKFLMPYEQAVSELKIKLRGMRKQYQQNNEHAPIEFVTGRVKPIDSIKEKMQRRYITEDLLEQDMQDIAGLRIMCQFVEDIHEIVGLLHQRTDMKIVEERDYVSNVKPSGYRSYHIVIEYPVQLISGEKLILAEIQIRTMSMNFWATIEHSLNYKYQGEFPETLKARLKRAAEASFMLDKEMSEIREEIQEAQQLFSYGKWQNALEKATENDSEGETPD